MPGEVNDVGAYRVVSPPAADGMVAYISGARAAQWLATEENATTEPLIFALRGGYEANVTVGMAIGWIEALCPLGGPGPVAGMFYSVPPHLLPVGMDVAFIEAAAFVAWSIASMQGAPIGPIAPIAAPSATARRNARARAKAKAKARSSADAPARPL